MLTERNPFQDWRYQFAEIVLNIRFSGGDEGAPSPFHWSRDALVPPRAPIYISCVAPGKGMNGSYENAVPGGPNSVRPIGSYQPLRPRGTRPSSDLIAHVDQIVPGALSPVLCGLNDC